MRVKLLLPFLVVLLFAVSASISSAKVPGPIFGTQDSCASVFTEDASACGGAIFRWYYIDSSPAGGYWVGQWGGECRYWQEGYITYAYDTQGYRYTIQCRRI